MKNSPKLNEQVYVVLENGCEGLRIVKGRVCGCREHSTAFSVWLFAVETSYGVVERFASSMWASVEELADDIKNFVEE